MNDRHAALDILEQYEATERMKQHHRAAFSGAASCRLVSTTAFDDQAAPQAAECCTEVGADDNGATDVDGWLALTLVVVSGAIAIVASLAVLL